MRKQANVIISMLRVGNASLDGVLLVKRCSRKVGSLCSARCFNYSQFSGAKSLIGPVSCFIAAFLFRPPLLCFENKAFKHM